VSVIISIPDEFANVLGASDEERQRRACEALALELYREGRISLRKMGELAGVGSSFWAAENLRARHGAPVSYSIQDLEHDRQVARELLP
jgi:predicted HTH domain antitoxin